MKLEAIQLKHIKEAASIIDLKGVPKDNVWSQYYVVVDGKEYSFKYLVRLAYSLVSDETLSFQSDDSYRNYIKNLGFKFTYYEGGYNFFTKDELEFYSSIANTDYRTSNSTQHYYGQKLYPIIAKTKFWIEQIKPIDFKLRKDGNWLSSHTARVKPYFWPRIYNGEDNDIFFNVEVNGAEQFIGFKLDGYYETTKALPEYKIKILDEFKDEPKNNWDWLKIPFSKLDTYNWDKLILESKAYLAEQMNNHNRLKKLLSKDLKIARITWNTNGWIKPSGRKGKSDNPSFESENGFGHEEWLFDGDKIIDGYKYGFLEPIHKHQSSYSGKVFDLFLYTKDSETGSDYIVANLKDVEVIDAEETQRILDYYDAKGWYNQMKEELFDLNIDPKELDKWKADNGLQLFNIKFKANQLNDVLANHIPIPENAKLSSSRYTLMDVPSTLLGIMDTIHKTCFSFEDSGSEDAELSKKGKRKGKNRI